MDTSSTSSPGWPRSGGRSRFSKALPPPPPPSTDESADLQPSPQSLPVRKDSLPASSRPKATTVILRKAVPIPIPTNMATRMMDTPLPPLPALARVNSPPSVVPKRKPVGAGASVKSHPSPAAEQPLRGGDISPVESIGSLLSAYGDEEDTSEARNSVETAATKYSTFEPSPPKVLPKDHLGGSVSKLDLMSPLALPTPLSNSSNINMTSAEQEVGRRAADQSPTPPVKQSQRSTAPKASKTIQERAAELVNKSHSPSSQSSQSPPQPQPQLLRRRSLKSDKPLTVPELKLTSSHGSTSSSQQVISSLGNGQPELPKPNAPFAATTGMNSPMRNGFSSFPGRNIRPPPSQKASPRSPQPAADMGNKSSKEPLDGFSRYAQEIENRSSNNNSANQTPQYSSAKMSPEIRRPPTPEYSKHDALSSQPGVVSPTSPMTPPEEPRPLSTIGEDVSHTSRSTPAPTPSSATNQAGLPPRTSSRTNGLLVGNKPGLPRSPRMNGGATGGASSLRPSPTIQSGQATPHARSISDTSVPTIEISDDGASTIKAPISPPRPATASSRNPAAWQQQQQQPSDQRPTTSSQEAHDAHLSDLAKAAPGDPNYFPMVHYKLSPIAPGTVLAPARLKPNQLDCFANHYRFTSSRNEDHPVACQSCSIMDRGMRFTCAHCGVRICHDCRDVLAMNGRDLNKLVEMLKA